MTVDQVYAKLGWVRREPREVQQLNGFRAVAFDVRDRCTGRTTRMLVKAVALLSEDVPVCVVTSWPWNRTDAVARLREMVSRCKVDARRLNVISLEQHEQVRGWGGCILLDHTCRDVRAPDMYHAYEQVSERATYCPNACAEFCR
jgi:hypothetical protein